MNSSFYHWAITICLILLATLASSWYGAVLYVGQFPSIVEYLKPLTVTDTKGHEVSEARPGQALVIRTVARRQPLSCWGTFTYVLEGPANYQFPPFRSQNLKDTVHNFEIKHLMVLPPDMPAGTYEWKVIVNPSCEGIDKRPMTVPLGASTKIIN